MSGLSKINYTVEKLMHRKLSQYSKITFPLIRIDQGDIALVLLVLSECLHLMACRSTPFEVTKVLLQRGHGKHVGSWWPEESPKASRGGGSPGSTIFPSGPMNTLGLCLSLSSSTYRDPIVVEA